MRLGSERIFKTFDRNGTVETASSSGHIDQLANKIMSLEERIENFASDSSKRYRVLKDNVKKLKNDIIESKEEGEKEFEHKVNELLQVERSFEETIDTEKQARKVEENKLFRQLDENYKLFKTELAREAETRIESAREIEACLNTDIPKLVEGIKQECVDREETDQNIIRKFQEEFTELTKEVSTEKQAREENEQAIFDMLKDVVERVKREIDNEKKERQASEESLLTLLEETCVKLNNATGPRP